MKPHQLTKLRMLADVRSKFEKPLPQNYFGNAVVTTAGLATTGELCEKAVKQIQKAVECVDEEYVWTRMAFGDTYRRQLSSVGTLVISSWTRFDYSMSNFGWGNPSRFGWDDLGRELCA